MMTSKSIKSILCIVEGKVAEGKILNKLNREYIHRNIEFVKIETNIYHFYNAYLKEISEIGNDIIMLSFLQKFDGSGVLKGKKPNDFLAIYLFMDLDRHEPLSNKLLDCIPNMLQIFNNQNENGKIYISYPMVEAFWHDIFEKETSSIELGGGYKAYVGNNRLKLVNKSDFDKSLITQIKQMNYLLYDEFNFPQNYQIDDWSQSVIYTNQSEKYIQPKQQCLVLSPFALFLLEYLGKELFLEWQKLDNH